MQRFAPVLLAVLLAGCAAAPDAGPDGSPNGAEDPDAVASEAPVVLRFQAEDRAAVEEDITIVVDPQDACIPVGCALWVVSGEPVVVKEIDLTHLLPPGTHAHVEATATWDRTLPEGLAGGMNLQWNSFDLWLSAVEDEFTAGEAHLAAYVTNHGDDPARMILVVLEPERMHEPVEVTVHVRVSYLDDAVHATHVVSVGLRGEAVPVTVHLGDGDTEARLLVRGPSGEPVLEADVGHNETVRFPVARAGDEYRFVFFHNAAPAQLLVPAANLSAPLMQTVDTTARFGDWREVPAQGEESWTVALDRPPYWVGLLFDSLDGRSHHLDAEFTITAPDGTILAEGPFDCTICFQYNSFWGGLARPEYTAGDYTFTIRVDSAQGWRMAERIGPYGD